jgi:dipeptidyl aminopeptidase/acylaminoacyl peptidase
LDLRKGIYLSSYNTQTGVRGYARLEKGKITPLSSGNFNAGNFFTCLNPEIILYEQQGYDLPPRVVAYNTKRKDAEIIAESNTHHRNFEWGHSEILSYNVGTDSLKGVLIYPAGYTAGENYPMITYIYERLLHRAQEYVNPSPYDVMGFNIANLSAQGYFILLPDIRYRPGHSGQSALECVTAAVDKVVKSGRIDPSKMGIVGHSFGGFETNYIVAHSKLFAAAISGAGISDPAYMYLSYGEGTTEMDYWRFEDQQFRLGRSFFDAPELYMENSTIFSAAAITTPLLIWSGKKDPVVNPDQSFMLFAAMRRLRKKSILLLYPDEVHALALKKNQADMTMRTESWFGHYLKGIKADWIE